MNIESFFIQTPIGRLQVLSNDNKVIEICMSIDDKQSQILAVHTLSKSMSSFGKRVKKQLENYFSNTLYEFCLDINAQGTEFQQSVWDVIRSIKFGETMSYSDIAIRLNTSARAVGNACRANPVPIIVPCHRVVAKSGIGGFAGQRKGRNIDVKSWLLAHEQAHFISALRA